jgi:hypothetical protein
VNSGRWSVAVVVWVAAVSAVIGAYVVNPIAPDKLPPYLTLLFPLTLVGRRLSATKDSAANKEDRAAIDAIVLIGTLGTKYLLWRLDVAMNNTIVQWQEKDRCFQKPGDLELLESQATRFCDRLALFVQGDPKKLDIVNKEYEAILKNAASGAIHEWENLTPAQLRARKRVAEKARSGYFILRRMAYIWRFDDERSVEAQKGWLRRHLPKRILPVSHADVGG